MLKTKDAYMSMQEFQTLMMEDFEKDRDFAKTSPSHFSLRTLYRTGAALLEGLTYQLRLVCFAAYEDNPEIFDPSEVLALKEKLVSVNSKGKIEENDYYQSIQNSILFTFSMFAKIQRIEFSPNTSDHRWGSLRKFIKIRNSLMHPKSLSDFEVDEEKNMAGVEGVSWFYDNLNDLYRACEAVDKKT